MSFSRDAKLQILALEPPTDCCGLAFLSALFHASGEIEISGGKKRAYILTDIQEIYPYINKIFHNLYGDFMELDIEDDYKINKTVYYRISLPEDCTDKILKDLGFIDSEGNVNLSGEIDEYIVKSECCKKAFVQGAFLGSATSSIRLSEQANKKTNTGYHIEFTSHSHNFLQGLSEILAGFNIFPKLVERKNLYVLYLKEASQVSDLLALVGAYNSVLELQNELAVRELRNKVNRQTNCMNANISKTVEASLKQLEAINTIESTIGLDSLPNDLQEVALLRLANTEESLDELLKLSKIKLTKSGLNHRFRKIIKLAKELEE